MKSDYKVLTTVINDLTKLGFHAMHYPLEREYKGESRIAVIKPEDNGSIGYYHDIKDEDKHTYSYIAQMMMLMYFKIRKNQAEGKKPANLPEALVVRRPKNDDS